MKAHEGSRGIALASLISTLGGGACSIAPGFLTPREISPVPIAQEVGSPGDSLDVLENRYSFASAGTRNPDRPARSLVTIMTELTWLLID